MRQLPVYKGYTIDFRLQELRKIEFGKLPEFIPFRSKKGQKLLKGFFKTPEGKKDFY
jgi:hypothetical protein